MFTMDLLNLLKFIFKDLILWYQWLERIGLLLHQKIDLSMPNTTNSLIEPQEAVKPCRKPCEGRWPTTNSDEEVVTGCYTAFARLFPNDEIHKKVRQEFGLFASKSNLTPYAIKDQNDMGAITWWYMYGQPFKHLQPLAIKILSQVSCHLFIYF